jgi:hypothetical protein
VQSWRISSGNRSRSLSVTLADREIREKPSWRGLVSGGEIERQAPGSALKFRMRFFAKVDPNCRRSTVPPPMDGGENRWTGGQSDSNCLVMK